VHVERTIFIKISRVKFVILSARLQSFKFVHAKVSFHPSGCYLLSGSQDKKLIIFDLLEARPLFDLYGPKNSVNAVKFSPGVYLHKGLFTRTTNFMSRHNGRIVSNYVQCRATTV
jgi:WD40 repeat protein